MAATDTLDMAGLRLQPNDSDTSLTGVGESSTDPTLEDLQARHRRERKDHQARVQALKKTADKKRKKEVLQQIADLDAALEQRHADEERRFETAANSNPTESSVEADPAESKNPASTSGFLSAAALGAADSQRLSKAQKRRDKKSAADAQLREDIAAQAELNKTGARTVETQRLIALLRERGLRLHTIPSDGHCLYAAVDQQLRRTGRPAPGVQALRDLAADYIESRRDDLMVFMVHPRTGDSLTEAQFGEYVEHLRARPVWGGQLEIRALSEALRVAIEVLQASGPPTVQDEGGFGGERLVLTYHRHMYSLGEHYNGTEAVGAKAEEGEEEADELEESK